MGATAALLLGKKLAREAKYKILGLLLDSPYYSLEALFRETANKKLSWMPKFIVNAAMNRIDDKIK